MNLIKVIGSILRDFNSVDGIGIIVIEVIGLILHDLNGIGLK